MRTIGVVTVGRSDYGIYLPVLRRIQDDADLRLHLLVAGMHLAAEFGSTVRMIEDDGFPIAERIDMLLSSDTPEGIAKSMGIGLLGFAQAYRRSRPDLLLVLGDRFEMYAAVAAAVPFGIPLAHLHGGELTEGAIDDGLRHSMTKLSHLHFVATETFRRRVIQMGEEPWRVIVSGAPSLDHLPTMRRLDYAELKTRLGLRVAPPMVLATFHPVTLEYDQAERQVGQLLEALQMCDMPVVITAPNADTNGRVIRRRIERFVERSSRAQFVENVGIEGYFNLMAHAAVMVGNSSSGLIEAPSFGLPVVNIGTRQQGRLRAANVIDVGYERTEILAGIRQALEPTFRDRLRGLANPYGNGQAARVIVETLKTIPLTEALLRKRFVDLGFRQIEEGPAGSSPTLQSTPSESFISSGGRDAH